jgi:DNA-binding IclR family transcriptional regulator
LEILRVLGDSPSDCSLAELCATLNLHKSTVHRLMMVLERHRLVDKRPDTGRYRLGLRLFELGSKAISVLDLRERSRPFLDQVLSETQETVHLCILDEGEVLYLEKLEPHRSVRLASRVGRRVPAYCTSVGKAILAELPEAEVDSIIRPLGLKRITPNTITTPSAFIIPNPDAIQEFRVETNIELRPDKPIHWEIDLRAIPAPSGTGASHHPASAAVPANGVSDYLH